MKLYFSFNRLFAQSFLLAIIMLVMFVGSAFAIAKDTGSSIVSVEKEAQVERDAAAKRRADGSEFERKKLNQSAFADTSSKKGSTSKSNGTSLFRMIFGLLIVVGSIFVVQWLLKKWAQAKLEGPGTTNASLIDVVATTSLAQGKTLHLVRIADEIILIGATDQSITRLSQIDANEMVGSEGDKPIAIPSYTKHSFQSKTVKVSDFNSALEVSLNNDHLDSKDLNDGPFFKRFINNLKETTAR